MSLIPIIMVNLPFHAPDAAEIRVTSSPLSLQDVHDLLTLIDLYRHENIIAVQMIESGAFPMEAEARLQKTEALDAARHRLSDLYGRIQEAAARAGFPDTYWFKKEYHLPPAEE